jgi:germination protein M
VGTVIPQGTTRLGLDIAGGTATVDLSSEYQSGGGSLSMTMRLAQVVYTLTQFPTVQRVALRLDGAAVTVFSGEGIVLDRPQTRRDYESLLPVIAVAAPGLGDETASPIRVSGLANVFEANVSVELLDRRGDVIAHDVTTASCGTGCWGSFALSLPYHVDERQAGTVVVHDDDAAGTGTFPHEERIPIVLIP